MAVRGEGDSILPVRPPLATSMIEIDLSRDAQTSRAPSAEKTRPVTASV
jgi:hypothetical protein